MVMNENVAAGLLMCRSTRDTMDFFLVHPGGPFYAKKDTGVWTIPKGIPEIGEDLIDAAKREFQEETGIVSSPPYHAIGSVRQKGGKLVHAWTFLGDWDPATGITCNTFIMEWPPRSGKMTEFPEMDKARWMEYDEATRAINPAQIPFLDRAMEVYKPKSDKSV